MALEATEKPTGNVFHFSPTNTILSPKAYERAPHPPSPKLQEIAAGLQKTYVREGWQQAGTLISVSHFIEEPNIPNSLAFVFTHPDREAVTKTPLDPRNFINPEMYLPNSNLKGLSNTRVIVLNPDYLNQLLSGTNLRSELLFAAYNVFNLREKVGFFGKDLMNVGYYQNGVAFLFSRLETIGRQISTIEDQMGQDTEKLIQKIGLLDAERTTLQEAKVSNPIPLL